MKKMPSDKALGAMVDLIATEICEAQIEQRDKDALLADHHHTPETTPAHLFSCCANDIALRIRSTSIV
jgi:hypothetical protein